MSWRKLLLVGSEPLPSRVIAFCAIIGFFAGASKALLHRTPLTTWKDIIAGACASSLASTIVGLIALYALGSEKLLLVLPIAGVAGWLGAALLDYLGSWAMTMVQQRASGVTLSQGEASGPLSQTNQPKENQNAP